MSSAYELSNTVFFDLSVLEASSAPAFLKELAVRDTRGEFPAEGSCSWILELKRGRELLKTDKSGFFKRRLESGDRLYFTNPTGQDWNTLFPFEAAREIEAVLSGPEKPSGLFLTTTTRKPSWPLPSGLPLLLPQKEGLLCVDGKKNSLRRWGTEKKPGAWWLVPATALLSPLPRGPWSFAETGAGRPEIHTIEAPSPREKLALTEAALLRKSSTAFPKILFQTPEFPGLGTREAVDTEAALGGVRKRALVASLQGAADLNNEGLRARFDGGKLSWIRGSDRSPLCTGTASYLEWRGKRRFFQTISSFSLSGDFSWGLRQSLVLRDSDLSDEGRILLDYFFVEESQEFFVSATVRWPRWKEQTTVTAWAPLELNLFRLLPFEALTVRAFWPDGACEDRLVKREHGFQTVSGTDFVFTAGKNRLVLGFPQNQTPRPHHLAWILRSDLGGKTLVVNPEGGSSPRSSFHFEGVEEHFSFYITLDQGAKLPFSVTRKQAAELIPPYVVELP